MSLPSFHIKEQNRWEISSLEQNYKVTYHAITSLCRVVFGLSTPSTGCYISFIVTGPVLESRENQKAGTARIATQVTRKERCINFFKM